MNKLTKRQQEILQLIQSHMNATGSPPTRAEIAKTMGFRSPNAAEDHLRALARKGAIELVSGTSRGIRLNQQSGIPIVDGDIYLTRNAPLFNEDTPRTLRIERSFFHPTIDFILRISNNNLQSQGIISGDYLAIHQGNVTSSSKAANPLIVVRANNGLSVQPHGSENLPYNATVEGFVVGVIRTLTNKKLG